MNRRDAMKLFSFLGLGTQAVTASAAAPEKLRLTDAVWKKRLAPAQ